MREMYSTPQHQHYYAAPIEHGLPPKPTLYNGTWWSRLSLRFLSLVFDIAILAMSGYYYKHWTLGPLIMLGPPAAASFLWSSVDIACLFIRRDRSGVHTSACFIVDLVIFLALAALSGVIAFTLSRFHDSGYYFAFFDNGAGEEYLRIILGFGILSTVSHLAIIGICCFQIKRKAPEAPRIIYVQAPNMHHPETLPPPSYDYTFQEMPAREQMQIAEVEARSHSELPVKQL